MTIMTPRAATKEAAGTVSLMVELVDEVGSAELEPEPEPEPCPPPPAEGAGAGA